MSSPTFRMTFREPPAKTWTFGIYPIGHELIALRWQNDDDQPRPSGLDIGELSLGTLVEKDGARSRVQIERVS